MGVSLRAGLSAISFLSNNATSDGILCPKDDARNILLEIGEKTKKDAAAIPNATVRIP